MQICLCRRLVRLDVDSTPFDYFVDDRLSVVVVLVNVVLVDVVVVDVVVVVVDVVVVDVVVVSAIRTRRTPKVSRTRRMTAMKKK